MWQEVSCRWGWARTLSSPRLFVPDLLPPGTAVWRENLARTIFSLKGEFCHCHAMRWHGCLPRAGQMGLWKSECSRNLHSGCNRSPETGAQQYVIFNKFRSYFPFRPRIMTKPGLSLPQKTDNGKKPGAKWFEDEVSGCSVVAWQVCSQCHLWATFVTQAAWGTPPVSCCGSSIW